MTDYTVKINGVEKSVVSLEYERAVEFTPKSFRVELPTVDSSIRRGDVVEIYRNGTLVFTGYITNIRTRLSTQGLVMVVEGLDNKILLRDQIITGQEAIGSEPANLVRAIVRPMVRVGGKSVYRNVMLEDNISASSTVIQSGTGVSAISIADSTTTKNSGANALELNVSSGDYETVGVEIALGTVDLSDDTYIAFYWKGTSSGDTWSVDYWIVEVNLLHGVLLRIVATGRRRDSGLVMLQ